MDWDWNAFGAIGNWFGAAVMGIFTWQLVKNDNAREERARQDGLRRRTKNQLAKYTRNEHGLTLVGTSIAEGMQKDDRQILFSAYSELYVEQYGFDEGRANLVAPLKFWSLVKSHKPELWNDFEPVDLV